MNNNEHKTTAEEIEDLKRRILKLNRNKFKYELFNFDNLVKLDYMTTVFQLRNYQFYKNDELFRRTDKERVKQFKVNQKESVSRQDVALLSFFKHMGVL